MGGSRKWFKILVGRNKTTKAPSSKNQEDQENMPVDRSRFWQWKHHSKDKMRVSKGTFSRISHGSTKEERAAILIQTEFRAFLARKALRSLKGMMRLQAFVRGHEVKKQAAITMRCMQSWIRIQSQVRARRVCMVMEGRIKQQKHEHQLKLEAELHDLEVDWLDGSETMEEILAKLQHREEAAVKRERAMAYAFSHQWRANSRTDHGHAGYEIDKTNWGWSWLERWIAVRPWENRLIIQSGKDGLESKKTANGHKSGQKHPVAEGVKRNVPPSIKVDQKNAGIHSSGEVIFHSRTNFISNPKERSDTVGSQAKKRLSLPNSEKPIMHKTNKTLSNVSQAADTTILAS